MGTIRLFPLFFTALLVVSICLVTAEPVFAQTGVTTPVLTGFLVSYYNYTVHHAPTYTVDPSTGTGVIDQEGYHTENRWVVVHISNQPFEAYCDSEDHYINAFYDVRWRVHGADSWEYRPYYARATSQKTEHTSTGITLAFKGFNTPSMLPLLDYVPGQQLDFQTKASIGYYTEDQTFVGKETDWSQTQIFTIPDDGGPRTTPQATAQPSQNGTPNASGAPNQNNTSTPNQNATDAFFGVNALTATTAFLLAVAVVLVFVVVFLRRRK